MKKLIRNTALAVGLGLLGILGLRYDGQRQLAEQSEYSAICEATEEIKGQLGKDASGRQGQELLDSLNINYKLKENERIYLTASRNGMYVLIEDVPSSGFGKLRGCVDRKSLDSYLSSHRTISVN